MESNEKELNEKCEVIKEEILSSIETWMGESNYIEYIQEAVQKRLKKEGISEEERKLVMQVYKEFRKMPFNQVNKMHIKCRMKVPHYVGHDYFEWTIDDHLSLRKKVLYPSRFYKFVAYGEDHNDKDSVIYEMIDKFDYNNEIYCYLKIIAVGFYTVEEEMNFYKLVKNEDEKKDKLIMIEDEELIEELKKHFTQVKDLI